MSEEYLENKLSLITKIRDEWQYRKDHAMWNDDGKGNHIQAAPMILKYNAQIELLNELIKSYSK